MAGRTPGRAAVRFASAPDIALGSLVGRAEQGLVRVRSLMNELMDSYHEAARSTDPSLSVERAAATRRSAAASHTCRPGPATRSAASPAALPQRPRHQPRPRRRPRPPGLNYQVIYTRATLARPGRPAQDIKPSQTFGEHARTRPTLPIKMVISDDRQALIPIRDPEEALTTAS
ncbi:MAG: hypothetical protein HOW97_10560 [Catenulispora sp.]|nr:hypothetical protein [Catenulispora sp.]